VTSSTAVTGVGDGLWSDVSHSLTPRPAPAAPADRFRGATRLQVAVALGTLYLVWGSTYLGIRVIVLAGMPPLPSMGVRFLGAGMLLAAGIAGRRGVAALRLTRRQLAGSAVVGLLLVFGGNGLVAVAERHVPSGLAALLISVTPLLLAVMRAGTGDRPHPLTWLGVAFGLTGIAILVRPTGGAGWLGPATVLTAALCWSTGSMISKRLAAPPDLFVSAAYQMMIAGTAQLVIGAATEGVHGLGAETPPRGWLALGYLVLIGSLVGYTAYYWLLAHAPISLVTTYTYVNPVVAVLLGWLVLGERLTLRTLVGGAVAVGGVAFVITAERLPARSSDRSVLPSTG
jgi:drug/metabolite transporter (DMT)-like permease